MVDMAQVHEAKSIRTMQTAPKVMAGHLLKRWRDSQVWVCATNAMTVAGHHIAVEHWRDSQVGAQRDE